MVFHRFSQLCRIFAFKESPELEDAQAKHDPRTGADRKDRSWAKRSVFGEPFSLRLAKACRSIRITWADLVLQQTSDVPPALGVNNCIDCDLDGVHR